MCTACVQQIWHKFGKVNGATHKSCFRCDNIVTSVLGFFEVLRAIVDLLEHMKQGQSSKQQRCKEKDDKAQHSNAWQFFDVFFLNLICN